MTTIHQVSARFGRLPISESNFGVFEALLRLPFDLYRPIVDMLLDGTLVPEDLLPPGDAGPAGSRAAVLAADSGLAAGRAARWANDIDGEALRRHVEALLAGGRPGAVALPRDASALAAGPDGRPTGAFAPAGVSVAGADSLSATPDPLEAQRAAEAGADAGKEAQAALAAALPSELNRT